MMPPRLAAALATGALLLGAAPSARAHDPPAGEDPLIHALVAHVLASIPGWLFVLLAALVVFGVWAFCFWVRAGQGGRFVDRVE